MYRSRVCLGICPVNGASLSPGDILVADQSTGTIRHYTVIGTDLAIFASGLASPSWITADRHGNVYVSEFGGNRIRKFSPSGVNLLTITTADTPGGIAIGADGSIYVAHYNRGKIHRYSASGDDLGIFALYECEPGCGTDFIKFDAGGNLYVGDFQPASSGNRYNGLIRLFSPAGEDLGNFVANMGEGWPEGMAFDANGNLYVGNFQHFAIETFSPSGVLHGTFAIVGDPGSAYGLDFDADGNLYAANFGGANIRKFSPTGVDLGIFASVNLVGPRDLVVIPSGGPATKDECKHGGWQSFHFPRTFKNQGDCVQFVETGK
jgi:tripartite motif-containing protein 71